MENNAIKNIEFNLQHKLSTLLKALDKKNIVFSLLLLGLSIILVTNRLYGLFFASALLCAIATIKYQNISRLERLDMLFIAFLCAYPLLVLVNLLLQESPSLRDFDVPSRFLLYVFFYIWFRQYPFNYKYLVIAAIISTVMTSGMSQLFYYLDQAARLALWDNAINFAQVAFLLLLIALTPIHIKQQYKCYQQILLYLMLIAGLLLCIMSQTKMVIISFFLIVPVYCYLFRGYLGLSWKRLSVTFFIIAMLATTTIFDGAINRLTLFADYLMTENANRQEVYIGTSTNLRYEMLMAGILLAQQKPFWGHGKGNYKEAMHKLWQENKAPLMAVDASHCHIELLQAQIDLGLFGPLSLLLLFLGSLYVAVKNKFAWQSQYIIAAVVACWLLFGIADVQLERHKITNVQLLLLNIGFAYGMNRRANK